MEDADRVEFPAMNLPATAFVLVGLSLAAAAFTAAVATAAYEVLRDVVSTALSLSDVARQAGLQSLADSYASSLDDVPNGPFERQGVVDLPAPPLPNATLRPRPNPGV